MLTMDSYCILLSCLDNLNYLHPFYKFFMEKIVEAPHFSVMDLLHFSNIRWDKAKEWYI